MKLLQWSFVAACSTNFLARAENTIGFNLKEGAEITYQTLSGNTIKDHTGKAFDMSELAPNIEIFSPDAYEYKNDMVVDKMTGEELQVAVYQKEYDDDDKTVIIATVDENRRITEAEVISEDGARNTRLLRVGNSDRYMTFASKEVNYDHLFESLADGQEVPDDGSVRRNLRRREPQEQLELSLPQDQSERQLCTHQRGNRGGGDSECRCFKTINVAIVFDSDFCSAYGNQGQARAAIQTIISKASWMYQKDMCVKLNLAGINSPDGCNPSSSVFSKFNRRNACDSSNGQSDFLRQFSTYMNTNGRLGFAPGTTVHMFTGTRPRDSTIGCAWIASVCKADWSYGVDYALWNGKGDTHAQGILFAHELGHNLNALHNSANDHVMYYSITAATRGFSENNRNRIVSYLNSGSAQCDYNQNRGGGTTIGGTIGGP